MSRGEGAKVSPNSPSDRGGCSPLGMGVGAAAGFREEAVDLAGLSVSVHCCQVCVCIPHPQHS